MTQEQENRFWDELAPLVDGEAEVVERHADLLADSDALRDARHDASLAAEAVKQSGADYVHPVDFAERVLSAVDGWAASTSDPEGVARLPSTSQQGGADAGQASAAPNGDENPRDEVANGRGAKRGMSNVIMLFGGGVAAAVFAAAAVLLTVGAGYWWLTRGGVGTVARSEHAFEGTVVSLVRAGNADDEPGLMLIAGDHAPTALREGEKIPRGAAVRTDDRTRARLQLSDGSSVALNNDTELRLDESRGRRLDLLRGEIMAEVAHREAAPAAVFETQTGAIEVLGTKFQLSADASQTTVRVFRGHVKLSEPKDLGDKGAQESVDVYAGQEGVLRADGTPRVVPAVDLASALSWSELGGKDDAEIPIRGIGELRAKRPGETRDRERPLALARHKATVRIVGNVARTEVEEVFQNDGSHQLEGIFRFPLPAGARIASLQLLVDGEWEEGAIVDRDRAKKIWRGVIRNATPRQQRKVERDEYIWVPGPWRDPALLEWQRGGQFELRIFPIPARGSRSVRIAYTEDIAPRGARGRRYVHPLAHSEDASTRVGDFEVDIRISGHDGNVRTHGYDMSPSEDGTATRIRFKKQQFLPNGDLMVDYELKNADAELRWWTFQGDATVAPAVDSREEDDAVQAEQHAIDSDTRPYVAFALRPKLPAWTQRQGRRYAFVVDTSQSMVGERYKRAVKLVSSVVREMDRRDRFTILACDATCRRYGSEWIIPSAEAAGRTRDWLTGIEPAGSSDLLQAFREAATLAVQTGEPESTTPTQVMYFGDGMPSVGIRSHAGLHDEVAALVKDQTSLSYSTVGVGGDADTSVLTNIARAGKGHYVAYVPGQSVAQGALTVLEASYGASLQSPELELPEGVVDISPKALPTIRAGQEIWVVGRLTGNRLAGNVKLSGTVGGERYNQEIPVSFEVSTSRGNAFVPRKWATETIRELELSGKGADRNKIVALSKGFGVMSRHTSLLVLESEAMFNAFRVDRGRPALQWTGEEETEMGESSGTGADGADDARADGIASNAFGALEGSVGRSFGSGVLGLRGAGRGGSGLSSGRAAPSRTRAARPRPAPAAEDDLLTDTEANDAAPSREARRPASTTMQSSTAAQPSTAMRRRRPPRRPGSWQKKEWYLAGSVAPNWRASAGQQRRIQDAEDALRRNPDSRDRHRALVRALSAAGEVQRALDATGDWMERDRLDAEALTYKANLLAQLGKRAEAVRVLSGVADLAPDDEALHRKLATALDRIDESSRACAHRLALAELAIAELNQQGESPLSGFAGSTGGRFSRTRRGWQDDSVTALRQALRCEERADRPKTGDQLLERLTSQNTRERIRGMGAEEAERADRIRGALTLDARWDGSTDVDLALVDRHGNRLSWMGGRRTVVAANASTVGREQLGLRWASPGTYRIEVTRTDPDTTETISGTVNVKVHGERQRIPFTLRSERTIVGRAVVSRQFRLVPVSGSLPFR